MGIVILAMSFLLFLVSLLLGINVHKRLRRYQFRVKRDMFKIMDAKERLQRTIDYDGLTGLPSQFRPKEAIDNAIKEATLKCERVLVIIVDIVDLKRINNRHSHRIGDLLIKEIASRFESITSGEGFVCRYGGDEFLFCFQTNNQPWKLNNKVDSIRNVFAEAFMIEDKLCSVDCRMGVSVYPENGSNTEQLIDQAMSVLYRAKTKLHSQVLVITDELSEMMKIEERIEDDLSNAIDNSEIEIFFQPQIDGQTEQLRGLEALVRWSHPEIGFVRPDQFVEIAEELGLARKLGDYVARNACKQVVETYPNESSDVTVSINISPQELLLDTFVTDFIDAVTETGIRKSRVVLELTENILIEEPKVIIPVLQRIRNAGIHVSMDDFGTGYSSLSYFNTLPISELKIDRAFVKDLTGDVNEDISLIKAIVAIGKSKNLLIVVEGVETKAQRDLVSALGCDLIQGYYYSPRKRIDEVCQLFNQN